jgi:ABC-2 type transport system permease protein
MGVISMTNLLKWWQTIKISWSNHTVYRMNFFLQVIGPALVFFFVKYNLWSSIYVSDPNIIIKGYNFSQMIEYHVWAMVVGLLAKGHSAMNLSEDIRMGRISSYLIYPFNFWEFHTASFLSFQFLQTFVVSLTILFVWGFGFLQMPPLDIFFNGVFYCFFVSFFWFSLQYLTGLIGFWLEETWIIRVILEIVTAFLSGAIIPLELYPKWFVNILEWTPFPYLTFYPVKTFMGQNNELALSYGIVSFWIIIFCMVNHFVWKKGIRLYTAAGM